MTNKNLILKEVDRIGKKKVISAYTNLPGRYKNTILRAFSRGIISKEMAIDLENLTQISASFWAWPHVFTIKGERK